MGEAKPKCCGQVIPPGSYRSYNCGKNASLEHDGKHYCKLHHPPTVWAKRDARNAKWDAEWEEKKKKAAEASTAAEEQKRRADAYDQLVERVKELEEALDHMAKSMTRQLDLIAERAPGAFLDKQPVINTLRMHAQRAQKALSKARPNTAEGEAHADNVREDEALTFTSAHINYVARYGGRCRDCADESGVCPGSGLPCADSRKAIKHVFDALEYGVKHGYIKSPIASRAKPAAALLTETCPGAPNFDGGAAYELAMNIEAHAAAKEPSP